VSEAGGLMTHGAVIERLVRPPWVRHESKRPNGVSSSATILYTLAALEALQAIPRRQANGNDFELVQGAHESSLFASI
jgi:hypothetical protein